MLYRFKSQATADLILLPDDGETVLRLLGKMPSPTGIITVEQLPEAIATLENVARQDRAMTQLAAQGGQRAQGAQLSATAHNASPAAHNTPAGEDCEDDIDDVTDAGVSLAQRLAPFVTMLCHAQREGRPVVWGV